MSFTQVNLLKGSLHGHTDAGKMAQKSSFFTLSVHFLYQPLFTCFPAGTVCIFHLLRDAFYQLNPLKSEVTSKMQTRYSLTSLNGLNWLHKPNSCAIIMWFGFRHFLKHAIFLHQLHFFSYQMIYDCNAYPAFTDAPNSFVGNFRSPSLTS